MKSLGIAVVNRFFSAILLLALSGMAVRADGYPFDEETQRVMQPSLRLKLTPPQILEISSTGTLTFSEEQMKWIRVHYPAATNRTDVVTATFNDNHEGLTEEDVYCFWVAPDEVAVTLNEKHPKDRCPFGLPNNHHFPTDAQLKDIASRHIRLSPDGMIYFRGRAITLEQAFALIDEIARYPKPEREESGNRRWLYVVVPPPLSERERHMQPEERRTPAQIFDALSRHGASKSIQVGREW